MIKISSKSSNNKKGSKFLEQILVFIVSFVSLYGMAMFISMKSKGGNLMDGFANNQWPLIFLGLVLAAIINVIYYLNNKSKVLVTSVEFDDFNRLLKIEIRLNYSEEIQQQTIPYANLKYAIRKRSAWFLGYTYTEIPVYNENKIIGIINTAENWDNDALAIRRILDQLKIAGERRN